MKHMVSYKLKPGCVAENERLVAAVFEASSLAIALGWRGRQGREGLGRQVRVRSGGFTQPRRKRA